MDEPEKSYAYVQLFVGKKEEKGIAQIVYVNHKLDEFIYLLDVLNSIYAKVIANQSYCNLP